MDNRRLRGLDGLRGIAALGVVAYHYDENDYYYGLLGVELFFVISGFVILMSLEKANSLAEFALHRAARLYPAYWLSVLVAGGFLMTAGRTSIEIVLVNATMLQGFFNQRNLIDPYWTLTYELWFYVVMGALFALGGIRYVDRFALAWIVTMTGLRVAMLLTNHGHFWLFQLLFMPLFGNLFIAGMMLYRLHSGRTNPATWIALLAAGLYSSFGRPDWAAITPTIYFCANTAFIGAVYLATTRLALTNRALVWLGACSYSLYLLHDAVFMIAGHSLLAIAAAIMLARLSRAYIERPAQLWARGKNA
jgi:peptidoglycan/LPS O-acetylase OafA/YrhL